MIQKLHHKYTSQVTTDLIALKRHFRSLKQLTTTIPLTYNVGMVQNYRVLIRSNICTCDQMRLFLKEHMVIFQ